MSDIKKCKATVWHGWGRVTCYRKASMGDYCGVHHPDKVKARKDKQTAKCEQESAIRHARWDEKAKREERRDFCEKHFDALEAALKDCVSILQGKELNKSALIDALKTSVLLLAAIAKERGE